MLLRRDDPCPGGSDKADSVEGSLLSDAMLQRLDVPCGSDGTSVEGSPPSEAMLLRREEGSDTIKDPRQGLPPAVVLPRSSGKEDGSNEESTTLLYF